MVLRASLDEKVVRQIDTGSDHASRSTMTVTFSEVTVAPGEHQLKVDVGGWGFTLSGSRAAATTTYHTAPSPVIRFSDADTGELLTSVVLPVQIVGMMPATSARIATFIWLFSVPDL